jgi:hypothetical protein
MLEVIKSLKGDPDPEATRCSRLRGGMLEDMAMPIVSTREPALRGEIGAFLGSHRLF